MQRILRTLRRYLVVISVLSKFGLGVLRRKLFGGSMNFMSPRELRSVLEDLGGSFLKFGQLAAVRPDYFPEEYCRELLGLLDEVPPIEDSRLDDIFLKEYGNRPEGIFAKFERVPLAAASFGQVHEAWLPEGERVAVKVQRLFVVEDFTSDARFFSFLAWLVQKSGLVRTIDPVKLVREFIHWTERELDYIKEAENLERLRKQVLKSGLGVKIPKTYAEYSTRKILVMEFIEGRTLKSYFINKERPPNVERIFKEAVFFEYYSFLFDGFFHADPHPSNILITPDGGLAFIDAGIALEVKLMDRIKMGRFVKAVAKEDLKAALEAFFEMVRSPILQILEEARRSYPQHWMRIQFLKNAFLRKIKEELGELISRWHKAIREGGDVHEKSPVHRFIDMIRMTERSGIKMPESSVFFARTFLSIDIIALELFPEFNIPSVLDGFFAKYQEQFKHLEELPEELPAYLAPGLDQEWSEILRSIDEEIKEMNRELLLERASGMMESLE